MKTVWIVLGVLAALGLACCGGMLFLGKGLVGTVAKTNDEANQYAGRALQEIAKGWDIATMERHASKEFQQEVKKEDLQAILTTYKTKLGDLKSSEEFTVSNIEAKSFNGDNFVLIKTKAHAVFDRGSGDVTFQVIRRGEDWKLLSISIESEALKK